MSLKGCHLQVTGEGLSRCFVYSAMPATLVSHVCCFKLGENPKSLLAHLGGAECIVSDLVGNPGIPDKPGQFRAGHNGNRGLVTKET